MTVLRMEQLSNHMGIKTLYEIDQLVIEEGQRVGLIGENGSGKTSLLKQIVQGNKNIHLKGSLTYVSQMKETSSVKSGGEVTIQYLMDAFQKQSSLLLIDEPTNNLDQSHIEWVINEINTYPGAILFVSHDRYLLNQTVDKIWELNNQTVTEYEGNYDQYLNQKENERINHQKRYEKYKDEKSHLKSAIENKNQQAGGANKIPKGVSPSERRIKGAAPYYNKLQKKLHQNKKAFESRLAQLEVVEKPEDKPQVKMDLPGQALSANTILFRIEDLAGKVEGKLLWDRATVFIRAGDKIGIIGANGAGKSTFLGQIINHSNDIKQSSHAKIGYFDQKINLLDEKQSILDNIMTDAYQDETTVRTMLDRIGFDEPTIQKPVRVLSGGEKVKANLMKILVGHFNVLILDEPTNHLDIFALEALEEMLINFEGTLLLVTHDKDMIRAIAKKLLIIENQTMTVYPGTLDKYESIAKSDVATTTENERLLIDNEITKVLSQLSLDPENEDLDEKFKTLIKKRKSLE